MSKIKIRNNTARIWTIGERAIQPGATEEFTELELKPFDGSKVMAEHIRRKDLEIFPVAPPPVEDLSQKPKPNPLIGEVEAVKVEDSNKVAQLLQSGVSPTIPVASGSGGEVILPPAPVTPPAQ